MPHTRLYPIQIEPVGFFEPAEKNRPKKALVRVGVHAKGKRAKEHKGRNEGKQGWECNISLVDFSSEFLFFPWPAPSSGDDEGGKGSFVFGLAHWLEVCFPFPGHEGTVLPPSEGATRGRRGKNGKTGRGKAGQLKMVVHLPQNKWSGRWAHRGIVYPVFVTSKVVKSPAGSTRWACAGGGDLSPPSAYQPRVAAHLHMSWTIDTAGLFSR
jgi:hypothetical protein